MNKPYTYLLLLLVMLASCKKTTETVTYDVTDATIKTFALTANDTFPGLAAATFVVESLSDTGLIYPVNNDSLRYGTRLTKVRPRITFNSRPSAALYYIGDTVKTYTGYDTIDLTQEPVYLRVYAANRTDQKYYRIRAFAHQIDPDQYVYSLLNNKIGEAGRMQVVEADNSFYAFIDNGNTISMTSSADGKQWLYSTATTGLPTSCMVRQIVYDSPSKTFCYAYGTAYYLSTDGLSWTKQTFADAQYQVVATLLAFDSRIWLLAEKNQQTYLLAYSISDNDIKYESEVDSSFPVSDYAVTCYTSEGERRHALIYGGYDKEGEMVSSAWTIEQTGDTYRLIDLSSSRHPKLPIAGAAVVYYNRRLLRFGGLTESGQFAPMAYSTSEGLIWQHMDTLHLPLEQSIADRQRMSAIVRNNNIYLFGGQNNTQSFSDVYMTRLNSIDWQ